MSTVGVYDVSMPMVTLSRGSKPSARPIGALVAALPPASGMTVAEGVYGAAHAAR